MTKPQSHLMAFGLGYTAQTLCRQLKTRTEWACLGTVRQDTKAKALRTEGIQAFALEPKTQIDIPDGAHWLISAPPGDEGCPIYTRFVRHLPKASSLTYLSTTGVYGDLQGGWAFEWSPVNPSSERARRRVQAEEAWQAACLKEAIPYRTVRLPGIYGPGRSPLERVRTGTARRIIKAGQVFSRIHVEDLASGLQALLDRRDLTGVFHLCDDAPAPPQDVISYAAELLNQPPPVSLPFEETDLSPMAKSFYAECKRISNARIKAALGWKPLFPTYKSGLKAVLMAEDRDKNSLA